MSSTTITIDPGPWYASVLSSKAPEPQGTSPIRLGLYARISEADDELGVNRQLREMREALTNDRWLRDREVVVIDEYVDNDISAYDITKVRPQWLRMLGDVESGRINSVAGWHPDRIIRQNLDLELLIRSMESRGGQVIWTASNDNVDIETGEGLVNFRIKATIANDEARKTVRRVRSKARELAENGSFSGGKRRYGYTADMSALVEEEAAVIREVAQRMLAGETVTALARELNERGVPTALGGRWANTNLQRCVTGPHVVGLRMHHGTVYEATWPTVLDRNTWHSLQMLVNDPERKGNGGYGKPKHPLSMMLRCGKCGKNLRMQKTAQKQGAKPYWQCNSPSGCHGINRSDKKLSPWIIGEILAAYRDPTFVAEMMANGENAENREQLFSTLRGAEAALEKLEMAYWAPEPGTPSPPEKIYIKAKATHEKTIADIRKELRLMSAKHKVNPDLVFSGEVDARWDQLPLHEQRALVAFMVDYVTIHPVERARKSLTPEDHYEIHWVDRPRPRPTSG